MHFGRLKLAASAALLTLITHAGTARPAAIAQLEVPSRSSNLFVVRYDRWTGTDEREFGEFVARIGESGCHTVDKCLHGTGNPFRASDLPGVEFRSDCADFPYVLRAYFAWKRSLPFSYESAVEPRGQSHDFRYSKNGNQVTSRADVLSYSMTGYALLDAVRDSISSASYRIHPDLEDPLEPDLYSPAIEPKTIGPGTLIYDPNGHVATIYRVDPDGRIDYIDAHPDNSVTRGFYDERFVRSRPGMGAGFKNWRPLRLVDAIRRADGVYVGGRVVLASNADIPEFSEMQFFGTGRRPAHDSDWSSGAFALNGAPLDYYDYVRASLAGGRLEFDPLKEVRDMVESNCNDLHYRDDAVRLSLAAGMQSQPEPERLPPNIYGTDGDWETYSTPSRDARLKTAFRELRLKTERFVRMYRASDNRLVYKGQDLVADLLSVYDREAAACRIVYARSDGSPVSLTYEEAWRRLFLMSFDPYQCVERRWGATRADELATCRDGSLKQAWYLAEQGLRNQIDRTYDAEMDFSLVQLTIPGPGKGVASPPDIDARSYLVSALAAKSVQASTPKS